MQPGIGTVVAFVVAVIIAWGFGVVCGAAAMIGFDEGRKAQDNRPPVPTAPIRRPPVGAGGIPRSQ